MELVVPSAVPEQGQLVRVRDRHWLVTGVAKSALLPEAVGERESAPQHLVTLSSVDDDGIDDSLTVFWELEGDARVLERATLPQPRATRFDEPDRLRAFLDAVRWGAIASADQRTLQAPFRSGISIEEYQLDPVVRALEMPRVNLLIADDVGLGKTIEAGLVVEELLLRHRARSVLVLCPPALRLKWQREMLEKFGLSFEILDADRVRRFRRERGVGADIFRHFPRTITSFDWLKDARPLAMLRQTLPIDPNTYPRRFDLLIVDEVHQCAPAGNGSYATDSLRTQLLRLISPHVEHRLFLSATPHNGYESSYSALLELLDPQRFARGIKPEEAAVSRAVVRRMKEQIDRDAGPRPDGRPRFPKREVRALRVRYGFGESNAHRMLERYKGSREQTATSADTKLAVGLTVLLLKKRLFSSPAAFAQTLDAHLRTLAHIDKPEHTDAERLRARFAELDDDFDADEDLDDATEQALLDAARASGGTSTEQATILQQLRAWADAARMRPDAKAVVLVKALRRWCCPTIRNGERVWNNERVIIFTEYRATQKWLFQILTDHGLAGDRLALLYGGMDDDERQRVTAEFQADPSLRPVRLLLATDTASEGIDLQKHCRLMLHVEIPFNPVRLEQRNGRIDRHGQPSPEVRIYHFVGADYEARPGSLAGDLEFLSRAARKVEQIRADLGDAGTVLAREVERAMLGQEATVDVTVRTPASRATLRRLERELRERIAQLRERIDRSVTELGIEPKAIEHVVRVGLELGRQAPLQSVTLPDRPRRPRCEQAFAVPELTRSWASAAAGLYDEIRGQRLPVTFDHAVADGRDDVVLAHLGHPLVAQSLRLLRAEMWSTSADASVARVSGFLVDDAALPEPTLIVHARLVVVGVDGARLHEELIAAGGRLGGATGFARYNVGETQKALGARRVGPLPHHHRVAVEALWPRIIDAVQAAVEARGAERRASLERTLAERAERDVAALREVLADLQASISRELDRFGRNEAEQLKLFPDSSDNERRQLQRDVDALRRRVDEIPAEIERETSRLRRRYDDPRAVVFPAAIEILVPRRFAEQTLDLPRGARS